MFIWHYSFKLSTLLSYILSLYSTEFHPILIYDQSEPDLISSWLVSTPTSVLQLLIVHFTPVVLLSSMIITKNEWTCLLTLLWSSTIWKILQRLSSFLPDKTSSFKKTFSTMLQFVGLLLQWKWTLHSLDFVLKIHSGINNLISNKLEHPEEVSQS